MKKKKGMTMAKREALSGYLFILPFMIGFLFLFLQPLVTSLIYSFSEVRVGSILNIGLKNYNKAFLVDPIHNRVLLETIIEVAINTPGVLIFSFIIANMLNVKFKGRTIARAILFLPVIITSGAIAAAENNALISVIQSRMSSEITVFQELSNFLLATVKIDPRILNYVIGMVSRVYIMIKLSGVQILIFLAGLQTISPSLYEASDIEGATAWENFWKITMPMISPYILVCWVFTFISQATNLNNWMMEMITRISLRSLDFGYGSAIGWIYMMFILLFTGITSFIISKGVFYYD